MGRDPSDLLNCFPNLVQDLVVQESAVHIPDSDKSGQDAPYCPLGGGEDERVSFAPAAGLSQ